MVILYHKILDKNYFETFYLTEPILSGVETVMWVAGQSGFTGNARADELAKQASEEAFTDQKPVIGFTHGEATSIITKKCNEEHSGFWLSTPEMVHSKEFM